MSQLSHLLFSQINNDPAKSAIVCGRYAPSPTGPLHFGNLRTALIAWLQTRLNQGRFILRIEDIDQPRTRPGCSQQIIHDLKWLGLDWDEGPDMPEPPQPYTQSDRLDLYHTAVNYLLQQGLLYPCSCSRKDIEQAASAPHHSDNRLIYPGTCRPPTKTTLTSANDGKHALRFCCQNRTITFEDRVLGIQSYQLQTDIGDFVIKRADGLFSYHLAVSLDDALMGVTDVVRGGDLVSATAQQILLLETFNLPRPNYWHIPLVYDDVTGKRLAKRDGALSVKHFIDQGKGSAEIVGQLASSLGLVAPHVKLSAQDLLKEISIEQLTQCLKKHSNNHIKMN